MTFTFDGSRATKASSQADQFFNVNQTTQVRDNLRTRATLDWSPSRRNGMLPALDGATYPKGNFDIIDKSQNYTASVTVDLLQVSRWKRASRSGSWITCELSGGNAQEPDAPAPDSG